MAERGFTCAGFNQYLGEKKLVAARCSKCKALHLPPRQICAKCGSVSMEWAELTGKGKLAAFTSIAVGTTPTIKEGFDRNNPYCCGVVELEEGPKISGRLIGVDARKPETIKVGSACTAAYLDQGECDARTTILAFKVS